MKKVVILLLVALLSFALVSCNGEGGGTTEGGTTEGGSTEGGSTEGGGSADGGAVCAHTFGEWTTAEEATCKKEGKQIRACTKCSEAEEKALAKSDRHTPGEEQNGLVRCAVCDAVLEDNRPHTVTFKVNGTVIEALSLKEGETITAPTPEGSNRYVWDSTVPTVMPSRDLVFTAVAIGGSAGGRTTWEYNFNGKLKIGGTGDMVTFTTTSQPWHAYKQEITSLEIANGITKIGKYAFFDLIRLEKVVIPDSVTWISDYAFAACDGIRDITLGAGLIYMGEDVFVSSYNLERLTVRGTLNWTAVDGRFSTPITFSKSDPYKNASILLENCRAKFVTEQVDGLW